jgi:predicted transglutaminase-like cysteine proteinase
MARLLRTVSFGILLAGCLLAGNAEARNRTPHEPDHATAIVEAAPVLAPFQHVRFCLRNPAECKSDPAERERIELNEATTALLQRVNREINRSIAPTLKSYGANLADRWTIAPASGDCNDYAVTKRHELIAGGLPARALRLAVVKTASDVGHLVLIVATTSGDLVLDNLTDAIRPWQATAYQWLKIQSATDARFWSGIRTPRKAPIVAERERRLHLASR